MIARGAIYIVAFSDPQARLFTLKPSGRRATRLAWLHVLRDTLLLLVLALVAVVLSIYFELTVVLNAADFVTKVFLRFADLW